jgi:hypothetical protein
MNDWNSGGLQFLVAQAVRPEAPYVRFEFRTVESFGHLG